MYLQEIIYHVNIIFTKRSINNKLFKHLIYLLQHIKINIYL